MATTDQDSGAPKVKESLSLGSNSPQGPSPRGADLDRVVADEAHALGLEVERLRDLIGPDELSYNSLKLELWRLRDAVIGQEAELGNVRGRCLILEREREYSARSNAVPDSETVENVDDFIVAAARRVRAFRERRH